MIRVLIVAASAVVRAGLEALLARGPGLTVVGSAAFGESLGDEIEAREPDVVLVAPGLSPAGARALPPAATLVRLPLSPDAAARAPAVVVLVDGPTPAWVAEAMRAGVRAVLGTDASPEEIFAAVDGAAVGLVSLPFELAQTMLAAVPRAVAAGRTTDAPTSPLTAREIEILGTLAEGLANKQIGGRLGISEHTVKTHVASILAKLDAYTRAEAVAIGARLGLILL